MKSLDLGVHGISYLRRHLDEHSGMLSLHFTLSVAQAGFSERGSENLFLIEMVTNTKYSVP